MSAATMQHQTSTSETDQFEEMIRNDPDRHSSIRVGDGPSREERRQHDLLKFLEIAAGV